MILARPNKKKKNLGLFYLNNNNKLYCNSLSFADYIINENNDAPYNYMIP